MLHSFSKQKIENVESLSNGDKLTEIIISCGKKSYKYIGESWQIRTSNVFIILNE